MLRETDHQRGGRPNRVVRLGLGFLFLVAAPSAVLEACSPGSRKAAPAPVTSTAPPQTDTTTTQPTANVECGQTQSLDLPSGESVGLTGSNSVDAKVVFQSLGDGLFRANVVVIRPGATVDLTTDNVLFHEETSTQDGTTVTSTAPGGKIVLTFSDQSSSFDITGEKSLIPGETMFVFTSECEPATTTA